MVVQMKDELKEIYILKEKADGTVVTVRDLQLELLTIMDEIHRICVKNNIDYALMAGSALGICNYKGFIPWDDDMDIIINKSQYQKFIEALKKDLGSDFYFHCYETDKKYNILIPQMKIRKKNTYIKEVNTLLSNKCEGNGIFIDVVLYDNVSENKFIDEINRLKVKLLVPPLVLLDNIGFNPVHLKNLVVKIANKYGDKNKNSKYVSQPINIPWEKFLKEPVFLKSDVYPFKLYEFEGRQYYSYNNIEKIMKEWYGNNCLKRWNGKQYIDPYPQEKRKPKHVKNINLKSDKNE
jgi:lipopolysaccharide cholinephosphotransferase